MNVLDQVLTDLAAEGDRVDGDLQPLGRPVHQRPHRLQVGVEPARRDVVRVADVVTERGTLAADFTTICHDSMLKRDLGLKVRVGTSEEDPPGARTTDYNTQFRPESAIQAESASFALDSRLRVNALT